MEVWKSVTVAPRVSQNTGASPFQDFGMEQVAMSYIGPNGQAQSVSINPRMKDNVTVAPLPQITPARPATMAFSFVIVVNARVRTSGGVSLGLHPPTPSATPAMDHRRCALASTAVGHER